MAQQKDNFSKHPAKFLSLFVERMVPDYVREDHPMFIIFLRKYFEYLERETDVNGELGEYTQITDLIQNLDIDHALDSFIPEFEKIITKLVLNQDCIRQSQIWRKMNRCEIVGCHKNIIDKIFYFPLKDDMMEQEIMNRMKNYNILELPKMKLHKSTKQGAGGLMKEL